jgi:hypothetical protein
MKPLKSLLSACLSMLVISFCTLAPVKAQPAGFLPRDNNEVEAWQVYNKYKTSHEKVKNLEARIEDINKQIAIAMGSDAEDKADKMQMLDELAIHQKREKEALAAWQNKFYWRYGDLRWCDKKENGVVNDVKHGEMDHIAFALVNFPYDYKPGSVSAPADNSQSAPNTLTLELPGYWGHLNYTIGGARLNPPTGSDRGKVGGRQYTGELTGSTLTISGTASSENPSSGPGSMDYYELKASVSVGNDSKSFSYIAPKGEKLNQGYSLSVPVKPGLTGSFSVSLLEQNANYGPHGWVVSGYLAAGKTVVLTTTNPSKIQTGISKDGKTWTPVNSSSNLKKGDQVKTGPNATSSLKLAELIKMVLNKSGWLQVTNESKTSPAIKLMDGNLKLSLPTLPYGSSFIIECSQAIATVKGTSFELWENGQRSGIRVIEGMVEFKNKKTGVVTSVNAGQTVFADQQGTAELKQTPAATEATNNRAWGEEKILFKLESLGGVYNNPPNPTVFTLAHASQITKIMTYHWNAGSGANPGIISIRNLSTGEMMGTWKVSGTQDMVKAGPPHRYWLVFPNISLPAGKYEVVDSDRASWSTNGEMGNMGCAWVYGRE